MSAGVPARCRRSRRLWHIATALGCAIVAACSDGPAPNDRYTAVENGRPDRGLRLLAQYQCGSCHAIPGAATANTRAGPPLDGFGRRSYIAGQVPNGPATLQRWLQEPQALVPGTTMPDLGVSADDARDIAAYLLSLS